jgi:DNA repair exonuclease SbcCD ATPase subunit
VSVNKQLDFVKQSKFQSEERNASTIQRLVKQIQSLNDLYSEAKQETEDYFDSLCEKERELQRAIVHLQGAQDEIQQLLRNKKDDTKLKRENMQELYVCRIHSYRCLNLPIANLLQK